MSNIVIPIKSGEISVSLEHADFLRIYVTDSTGIVSAQDILPEQNVTRQLRRIGVSALVCGMLTDMSRRELAIAGITVLAGVYGNDCEIIQKLLRNELRCEPDTSHAFFAAHYSPYVNEHD